MWLVTSQSTDTTVAGNQPLFVKRNSAEYGETESVVSLSIEKAGNAE
jgi:hypothetical protein